ncbi:L-type lectin-domain containing receptor kinase IV.1-like isoform X1 [Magnolia sinica]|uniref:L-type lectin-domain containing receptor kinase IV.1-like isoform X1 n=1 Tax=Magnolia sinica TaxID=86752 RepID=UPI00265900EF|nr:L-type lectin-domain containing receptor kinase IV.1-like isoform X1 [Magnolia sinica]
MFSKLLIGFLFMRLTACKSDVDFIYNGFHSANMSLNGSAEITSDGLLLLINSQFQKGLAFYPIPLNFKPSQGKIQSFSTNFIFAIVLQYPNLNGGGAAFVISPSKELPGGQLGSFMGIFNKKNVGNSSNHIVTIELDTYFNPDYGDINDNHVGININGLVSNVSAPAAYFSNMSGGFKNLSLVSGEPMHIWVEYNGLQNQLNVTLSPINSPKPDRPLLSWTVDLSSIMIDDMYIGFSSSTLSAPTSNYILGWSFKMNGQAQALDPSRLPKLPRIGPKKKPKLLTIGLPVIVLFFTLTAISTIGLIVRRKIKFTEILEDWEHQYGPHRFSYKDLFMATKGFTDKELLGFGGFGRVYRGILSDSKMEVAVKRVSHESRQGMREFISEIVSLGRLRHRNLVQLLGYCRRKRELLLVYDFMPNGSLDKFLFDHPKSMLSWNQRFRIVKGVASGLLYLHEEWEQVVLHRDIKASNVLLDREMNGRLGDFGLARLYDHGTDPQTTHMVGTFGYLAPELTGTGKVTTSTDVFAFGAFMLEVACGRRPINPRSSSEEMILVEWVSECWRKGTILAAADPKLGLDFEVEEMELVMKLGLLCSHPSSAERPTMRQVMQFLDGDAPLPKLSWHGLGAAILAVGHLKGTDDLRLLYPSSFEQGFASTSSVMESVLSGGR